jgi:hypothetical protein
VGKLLTIGAAIAGTGLTLWLAARRRAEPQTGRKTMSEMTRDDNIKQVIAQYAQATDPAEKVKLKAQLDAEIAKRKAAEAEAATRPRPRYPIGLAAELAGKRAVVKGATWANGAWVYTVEIDAGMLIPNFTVTKPEAELRALLAEQVGQPVGPAYPRGITLYRNGQGGLIEDVQPDAGSYSYQVKGWPKRVTEAELAAVLGR